MIDVKLGSHLRELNHDFDVFRLPPEGILELLRSLTGANRPSL